MNILGFLSILSVWIEWAQLEISRTDKSKAQYFTNKLLSAASYEYRKSFKIYPNN